MIVGQYVRDCDTMGRFLTKDCRQLHPRRYTGLRASLRKASKSGILLFSRQVPPREVVEEWGF